MGLSNEGRVVSLRLNVGERQPMVVVDTASLVAGLGIEGDRHATPRRKRRDHQVLLIDEETLESLRLEPGQVRENVTTGGIDMASVAAGQRLGLGPEAVVEISKPCTPCSRMDEVRPGLQRELEGRRGMLAWVVQGGSVAVGDPIRRL